MNRTYVQGLRDIEGQLRGFWDSEDSLTALLHEEPQEDAFPKADDQPKRRAIALGRLPK